MRLVLAIATGSAMALALGACGGSASSENASGSQQLAEGKTFTMTLPGDPGNLDPHFTSLSVTGQVDLFLYDSLVSTDASGALRPNLAEKWESTTTKATFTLRKGVTCSDGTALTATQVAENFNFVANPKNASTGIGRYVPAGAKATADDATGVVTVNSTTPDAFLDRNLGDLPIVCGKGFANRKLLAAGSDGTGMFTIKDAVAGDRITLTRRKDYAWGPGDWKADQKGLPDTVVLKIVSNETTTANLLLSGGVNAATIAGPDAQRLSSSGIAKQDLFVPQGLIWFNQKASLPTADEAVRRALTQALDLGQVGQVLTSGTGKPSTGLVAPGMNPCKQNTVASNVPGHDVAAAKAALDAAGWTAGSDGVRAKGGTKLDIEFAFVSGASPGVQAAAELLQQQWKAIGVGITLKSSTTAQIGQIAGGQLAWDAAMIPLGLTLPSQLVAFVSGPTPPNGANFAAINNAEYTTNATAAAAIAGAGGCEKWAAAESALFKRVDLVSFVSSNAPTFTKGAKVTLTDGSVDPSSIRMFG
jgi:peptide/nickel transport system substrate-binding protein